MGKIDNYDDDAKYMQEHPFKPAFTVNFKIMSGYVDQIVDGTGEVTDKYPKSELLKLWGWDLIVLFFVFLISYSYVIIAAMIFYFFYGWVLFKIIKAWHYFKYKMWQILLMTVGALAAECGLAWLIRYLVFSL